MRTNITWKWYLDWNSAHLYDVNVISGVDLGKKCTFMHCELDLIYNAECDFAEGDIWTGAGRKVHMHTDLV